MDAIAMLVGHVVMIAGGIFLALLCLFFVAYIAWFFWIKGLNTKDLIEACNEWRINHPDKHERFQNRND